MIYLPRFLGRARLPAWLPAYLCPAKTVGPFIRSACLKARRLPSKTARKRSLQAVLVPYKALGALALEAFLPGEGGDAEVGLRVRQGLGLG